MGLEIPYEEIVQFGAIAGAVVAFYRLHDRLRENVRNEQRLKDQVEYNSKEIATNSRDIEKLNAARTTNSQRIFDKLDEVKDEIAKMNARLATLEAGGCMPVKK